MSAPGRLPWFYLSAASLGPASLPAPPGQGQGSAPKSRALRRQQKCRRGQGRCPIVNFVGHGGCLRESSLLLRLRIAATAAAAGVITICCGGGGGDCGGTRGYNLKILELHETSGDCGVCQFAKRNNTFESINHQIGILEVYNYSTIEQYKIIHQVLTMELQTLLRYCNRKI